MPGNHENVVKLNVDHSGVCKFGSSIEDQDNFKLVRGNISDLYKNALKKCELNACLSIAGQEEMVSTNEYESEARFARLTEDVNNEQRAASQERQIVANWLTQVDYGPQHSDILDRRLKGTGQWLLDSVGYKSWRDIGKQILFCPGIPGAGETILTAIVVEDLTTRFYGNPTIGIAYFYCNFKRQDEQKVKDLLTSLLKQLVQGRLSVPDNVKSLYEISKNQRTRPLVEEISSALQSVTAFYSRVFIIVDALDECQSGCRASFLKEIFNLQVKYGANFFATSRNLPEITLQFQGSILLEVRASDDDVRRYIDNHISELSAFVSDSLDLQEDIKDEIVRAVDGMFLLAQLYLGALEDKITSNDMKTALQQLQKQHLNSTEDEKVEILAQAYDQVVQKIRGQKKGFKQLAENVLLWIIYAKRPLATLELQHALAVRADNYELDKGNLPHIESMVSVCAGLVAVDNETLIIRLVHYTAQEYFERTQSNWLQDTEAKITTICVTYLSFSAFEIGSCQTDDEFEERLRLYRLYDYASHSWGHHARKASTSCHGVIQFLQNKHK